MLDVRRTGSLVVVAAVVCVLAVIGAAGCARTPEPTSASKPTALDNLPVAQSALATSAPDARLLEVHLADYTAPATTPVWVFLFGSPSTGKVFFVHASNGRMLAAQENGTADLSATEWSAVPITDPWPIDSDEAYAKALSASGASGDPETYMIGMETYKPSTDTSTVEPFVWRIRLTPGASGATTQPIDVDARTGIATVSD